MTRRAFLILVFAVGVTGCQASSEKPPAIRYGRDTCDECGMVISEARFAAAYLTRQGEWRLFDDIGDMLAFYTSHREAVAVFWVHDYETGDWLQANGAFFVSSPALHTPMGHNIVAMTNRERANRLTDQLTGEVLTFAEVLARFAQKS